jgi:hypothetical protein
MANIKALDAEIEKTRSVVNDMRSKIEVSGEVLERLSDADAKLGDPQFDIENARIQDVLRQQRMMETNIADLIIGLEDATNVFGAEFESMKGFSGMESFVAIFSKARAQRMRSDRVRNMSLAGNLQELLQKSDTITGISEGPEGHPRQPLQDFGGQPDQGDRAPQGTMAKLETTQQRIEELNPLLMDIENQIAASTDQKAAPILKASAPSWRPNTMNVRPRSRNCSPKARRWNATPRCSRPSSIRSTTRSRPRIR